MINILERQSVAVHTSDTLHVSTTDERNRQIYKLNRIARIQETRSPISRFGVEFLPISPSHFPFRVSPGGEPFNFEYRLALQFHSPAVFFLFLYSLRCNECANRRRFCGSQRV